MHLVYGLYLLGAAVAYVALNWPPSWIGMAKILAIAFSCTGLAIFAVGRARGRSERYFMVYLAKSAKKPARNELVQVKLLENSKNGVIGEV
jgi:hypothetical protein